MLPGCNIGAKHAFPHGEEVVEGSHDLSLASLNEQLLDRHRIGGLCECGSDVEESDEVSVVGAGRWLRSLTRAMSA